MEAVKELQQASDMVLEKPWEVGEVRPLLGI